MVGEGGAVGDGSGKSVSEKPNGYEKKLRTLVRSFSYTYYILSSSANLAKVAS